MKKYLRGSFIFTSLSFLAHLFSYGFNFLLAHLVSQSSYGEYSTALSYFLLLSVPFGAFTLIIMQKIGLISGEKRSQYVLSLEKAIFTVLKKDVVFITALIAVIGIILFFFSNLTVESVLFILSMTVLNFFVTLYAGIFQAKKEFLFAGLYLCLLAIMILIGAGTMVLFSTNLSGVYIAFFIIHLLAVLLGRYYLHSQTVQSSIAISLPSLHSLLLRRSFYLPVVTFLGLAALVNIDLMIVKKFFDPSEVGLYAGISLLGRIILYITLPLITVAFSFFSSHESSHQSEHILWLTAGSLVVMGVVSVLTYALLPNLVVEIIFNDKYLSISPLIWIAAIFGSIYSLAMLFGHYWVSRHHPLSMLSILFSGLQLMILLFIHQSFETVLFISIVLTTALTSIYFFAIFMIRDKVLP